MYKRKKSRKKQSEIPVVLAVHGGKDLWNRWGLSLEWKSKGVMDWTLKVMMTKTY